MTKLTRIVGFVPFVVVVFLNSFVDLGHKIIIQNTLFKAYDGAEQIWLTAMVNALILLPFILLFTPSGYLADRWRATVLCSTSSFLRLYVRNRKVHPIMLESLRIVVAGAERLSPDVRDAFALKFGNTIYEGYGTTETTPVASTNVPDAIETDNWKIQIGSKPGTAGMPLLGTSFRIVDPMTLQTRPSGEDGLIPIGGVQVMKGYPGDPERTADAVVELDGQRWYKTGDKGRQDADGFLSIVDRYSRFAKIGGEMVGLGAVEQQVRHVLQTPDLELCAVALPDATKKGERVVLLLESEQVLDDVRARLIAAGASPLLIPSAILSVDEMPRLGSGKTDFGAAKRLASTRLG